MVSNVRFYGRAVVLALSVSAICFAALSALAQRPTSDRLVATQILSQLSVDSGPASSAASRSVAQARQALARADHAHAAGDPAGGQLLEGLAREWAETAQDVARAVSAEADAGALQASAADASLRAQRVRAMVDELAARKARAMGELNHLLEQADGSVSDAAGGAKPHPKPPQTPSRASSGAAP
jgi:hypothetical protein